MSTASELFTVYRTVIQPYLQMFPANACIELTRILKECLEPFGCKVEPIETKLIVQCPEVHVAYVSGLDRSEMDEVDLQVLANGGQIFGRPSIAPTPGGHLVARVEYGGEFYMLDPSIAQASAPDYGGFIIDRDVLIIGPLPERPYPGLCLEAECVTKHGHAFEISYTFTDGRSYEDTPGWEPSHLWPLIFIVVGMMQNRVKVGVTQ